MSNTNSSISYDLKKTIKLTFRILGDSTIEGVLQTVYTFSTPVNLISTGQLKKNDIEYNKYKDYFITKIN